MPYRNLSHLTPEAIDNLYTRYLVESCDKLCEEYNLERLSNVTFPKEVVASCEHCGGGVFAHRLSKKSTLDYRTGKCQACKHEQIVYLPHYKGRGLNSFCTCQHCKKIKQDKVKDKFTLVYNLNKGGRPLELPFSPYHNRKDFTLNDTVLFMALLQARWAVYESKHQNNEFIQPVNYGTLTIYPVLKSFPSENHLERLYDADWLKIDVENSDLSLFTLDEDNKSFSFMLDGVAFNQNFVEKLTLKETYQFLYRKLSDKYWYKNWTKEFLDVWVNLAVSECIEFAIYKSEEYNFEFAHKEKIASIVRDLLKSHSVSECFYFIGVAYYAAAAFLQSNKSHGRAHAINTVPGKILSLANSGKREKWHRPKQLERSAFSVILFDVMLGTSGDAGFNLCPHTSYHQLIQQHEKILFPISESDHDEQENHVYESFVDWNTDEGWSEFSEIFSKIKFVPSNEELNKQLIIIKEISYSMGFVKAASFLDGIIDSQKIEPNSTY